MLVRNVLVTFGFSYFLYKICESYFEREVVSETLIELPSQTHFLISLIPDDDVLLRSGDHHVQIQISVYQGRSTC